MGKYIGENNVQEIQFVRMAHVKCLEYIIAIHFLYDNAVIEANKQFYSLYQYVW